MTIDEIIEILESYKNVEDNRCKDYAYHGYDYSPRCKQRKEAISDICTKCASLYSLDGKIIVGKELIFQRDKAEGE